jgi:hypothetical protein
LYIIVPVYVLALALTFFNSKLFTAVAFDSGGVATGALAVSFTLPFVTGLSVSASKGFGTIALVAAFPVFTMQMLGFIYKVVLIREERKRRKKVVGKIEIIEFDQTDNDYLLNLAQTKSTSSVKLKSLRDRAQENRLLRLKKQAELMQQRKDKIEEKIKKLNEDKILKTNKKQKEKSIKQEEK